MRISDWFRIGVRSDGDSLASSDRFRRYLHGGDMNSITPQPRHAVYRLRCSSSSRPGLVRWTRGSLEFAWPTCSHRALRHRSTASLRGLG